MIQPREELLKINTYETASYPENWAMKLDSNENYIGPSSKVLESLKNMSVEQISQYPYYGELYEKISELNNIDSSEFAITNGADEGLFASLNTFVSKGDSVLTVTPSFSMPKIYSEMIGANYIEIPYKKKWEYPFDAVKNAVNESVRAILITTPNNPTGDIVPLEQIQDILESYPDKAVIIDETYTNYAGISNVCLTKRYSNAIVVKSLSKDYGLAGLRLGYVVSNPDNIANMKKVLNPYNVNSAAALAGSSAISDKEYLEFVKKEIHSAKMFLREELDKFAEKVYPSHANFLLVDFGTQSVTIKQKLKGDGIIVKSFSSPELQNCLRITIPTLSASRRLVELIKPKDTLIFDMDGVLVDVRNSYYEAIKNTYKQYTGKDLLPEMIIEARKRGGLNNDWDLTQHLIKQSGFDFPYEDVVAIFQEIYWNGGEGAINNEELLIEPELLNELSKKYNMAIFTGRPRLEAFYTLEKFGLKKYFDKIITMDDVALEEQKPHTSGLQQIKTFFVTNRLVYFGDTVDDAKCAKDFGAHGVGVLPPSDKSEELKETLFERGSLDVIENINELKTVLEKLK